MYDKKINSLIEKEKLIEKNDHLVVGVSGGPDSMFLLYFLKSIQETYQLTIEVAHVNHQTRGIENIDEFNLIKTFCEKYKINFHYTDFYATHEFNFHDEARQFRYHFFIQKANEVNANKVVLAHHKDDQVETILFKMMRGNHISGYAGMKSLYMMGQIKIIRPLLDMTKDEILDYCLKFNIPYAIDSSNLKNHYTRNFIRHEIVPKMKDIQPDLNDKMYQFKDQLLEVNDYLEQNAKILLKEMIICHENDRIILDLNELKSIHNSILRYILYSVMNQVSENQIDLTYEKMNNVIQIIKSDKPNIVFDLGKDFYLVKEYQQIMVQKDIKEVEDYKIELSEFKEYTLPNGMKINIKIVQEKAKINNKSIILCYNSVIWPLIIRNRLEGDYIHTKIGRKKVNRIFINEKIPISLRKTWPLLVNQEGDVLWVIGIEKSDLNKLENGHPYILIEVL